MKEFLDLAERWREQAASPFLPVAVHNVLAICADELVNTLMDRDNVLLSPKEAAQECGLAPATIRKKLNSGDWPNEGTPYRPKVRRRALREAMSKQVATRLQVVR